MCVEGYRMREELEKQADPQKKQSLSICWLGYEIPDFRIDPR